ncbi:DUF2484 family protein [Parasedimentitalea psychrophila]|uniref:DUF2484 family protein n=1 Tax=Parasedimentitalea psychrophila TaxID=2997337 RepID=A0A9Y2P6Z3_9RHOB|nr:DUF2484 family protein [Parasedimentitalea psychrophila]WIY25518.1 DUF2484 family protein [Parasedimentitalea psychrophila]
MNSVVLAAVWALAATTVAFLPMRWQFVPGVLLLAAAPVIIAVLGVQHGGIPALIGVAAVVSMFRRPLLHYWRKWRGVEL